MWIQLIHHVRIKDQNGRLKLRYPGELVDMKNKDRARKLIKAKKAVDADLASKDIPDETGLLMRVKASTPAWASAFEIAVTKGGEIRLPFPYTIIWDPVIKPRREFLVITMKMLRRTGYDLAVPVNSYDKLANRIGNAATRARTQEVVHDLRVTYYQTALLFVKRNERTELLIKRWNDEMSDGSDERLAFMRALYRTRPYILPLPVCWWST